MSVLEMQGRFEYGNDRAASDLNPIHLNTLGVVSRSQLLEDELPNSDPSLASGSIPMVVIYS